MTLKNENSEKINIVSYQIFVPENEIKKMTVVVFSNCYGNFYVQNVVFWLFLAEIDPPLRGGGVENPQSHNFPCFHTPLDKFGPLKEKSISVPYLPLNNGNLMGHGLGRVRTMSKLLMKTTINVIWVTFISFEGHFNVT